MNNLLTGAAPSLISALTETPGLVLSFYSYGIIMRKVTEYGTTEYPVDPRHVATALAAEINVETGLLGENTLFFRQKGNVTTVAEYRPPQITGIFVEGSDAAIRCPLPGLVMIREANSGQFPKYQVYAVKKRPSSLNAPLYNAPLPNIFANGGVCWGTVARPQDEPTLSLAKDWQMLLGSAFGDHGTQQKSKVHKADIRKQLLELETRKARVYPQKDLVKANKTLETALGKEGRNYDFGL